MKVETGTTERMKYSVPNSPIQDEGDVDKVKGGATGNFHAYGASQSLHRK